MNKEIKNTLVISAYPCCGKTYAFEHYQEVYSILDSDSSNFSWIYKDGEKVRNPDFPNNYIEHIKENLGKVDVIFVSSHLQVREAMAEADIPYITVYPKHHLLNEWVGRMYRRGSTDEFIKFQIVHWHDFMWNIPFEPHGIGVHFLGVNQYIDIILLRKFFRIYRYDLWRGE